MANMSLGAYTFGTNPTDIPQMIQKDKDIATAKTFGGAATYSWAATYVGKEISLIWEFMSTAQYTSLLALFIAGDTITFDPQDGSGLTFTVLITNLDGAYFIMLEDATDNNRQNVTLDLFITAAL